MSPNRSFDLVVHYPINPVVCILLALMRQIAIQSYPKLVLGINCATQYYGDYPFIVKLLHL